MHISFRWLNLCNGCALHRKAREQVKASMLRLLYTFFLQHKHTHIIQALLFSFIVPISLRLQKKRMNFVARFRVYFVLNFHIHCNIESVSAAKRETTTQNIKRPFYFCHIKMRISTVNCSTCICCWLKHRFSDASVQSNRRNFCVWFALLFFVRLYFLLYFFISLPVWKEMHLSIYHERVNFLPFFWSDFFSYFIYTAVASTGCSKIIIIMKEKRSTICLCFVFTCIILLLLLLLFRCLLFGWSFCCCIRQNFTWDAFKKKTWIHRVFILFRFLSCYFHFYILNALWLFWSSCNWLWNLTLSSSWVWMMLNKTNIRSRITLIVNDQALKWESNGIANKKDKQNENDAKSK